MPLLCTLLAIIYALHSQSFNHHKSEPQYGTNSIKSETCHKLCAKSITNTFQNTNPCHYDSNRNLAVPNAQPSLYPTANVESRTEDQTTALKNTYTACTIPHNYHL